MMENYERCKVCDIPFRPNDKIMWCKIRSCPKTQQREPTEQQLTAAFGKKVTPAS